jgi:hypothetical protein
MNEAGSVALLVISTTVIDDVSRFSSANNL